MLKNVNLQGNITISGNVAVNGALTLAYVSGTITTTNSTLNIYGNYTLNTPTANMHWYNINAAATASLTLTSAIYLD